MNTKLPSQAKSTERLLRSVLPEHFKMVSDKNSNGYKYVNLLYGIECDNILDSIREVYNESFITSFDLSKDYELYEANLSGVPTTSYLNSSGLFPIKITNEYEFYNGDPTRIIPNGTLELPMYYLSYTGVLQASGEFKNGFDIGFNEPCWSQISGIIGLEYIRKDMRGSGYLIITSDIDQTSGFFNNMYPVFSIDVGNNLKTSGDFVNTYGIFNGVKEQNFSGSLTNEILYPIDSKTLLERYPLYREVLDDSGILRTIDHYEPYHGWTKNANGQIIAVVDYSGEYYYDNSGEKIYYKTSYNNPYGYNNYTKAYLDLKYIPISGTLKVYDIDILDTSGNATEIPYSGKNLYYYKSPKMFLGNTSGELDAQFDPIYLGYESIVPSGMGFSSNMEGSGCSLYKVTTWNYLHESGKLDEGSLSYIDGTENITNRISLSGYHSRYMVEYKYKIYDNDRYVSSLNSNGSISFHTPSPIITNYKNNDYVLIDYDFTKNPDYKNENSKIITFDGLKYRPGCRINKISFDIPFLFNENEITENLYINTNKEYAGYSNEFIPQFNDLRYYVLNCLFSSDVSGNLIETDLTNTGNDLTYSGNNNIFKINYNTFFGKKIINTGNESYFYKDNYSFLNINTFFKFDFRLNTIQNGRLLEIYDVITSTYIFLDIDQSGRLIIYSNNKIFYSTSNLISNFNYKSLILKYSPDEFSSSIPTFKIYFKDSEQLGYSIINLSESSDSNINLIDHTSLKVFKNMSIDIGGFSVFYED
ncbi:MAG: hypothetical protein M0R17_02405 [Candidatus Omnitrophica bacterium]|jgi:hypothetical protein|nr:hypothetical protein [Candidatus Omnitrophota bacterium]